MTFALIYYVPPCPLLALVVWRYVICSCVQWSHTVAFFIRFNALAVCYFFLVVSVSFSHFCSCAAWRFMAALCLNCVFVAALCLVELKRVGNGVLFK